MADRILSLAGLLDDPGMLVEGHFRLGYSLATTGDIRQGLEHLDQAIAGFEAGPYVTPRFHLGNHSAVVALNVSALLLWMTGYPQRALDRAYRALDLAKQLDHPYSLNYALFHAGLLHLWRREFDLAEARSQAALDLAAEHEFLVWQAVAACLHGAALAGLGHAEQGLDQVRQGIASYQELNTPPVFWPLLIFMQAEILGLAGQPGESLALLERTSEGLDPNNGNIFTVEVLRLIGDLLLALSPENHAQAEQVYLQGLEIARVREVRMLELRTALHLGRLWQEQGKAGQSGQLLSEVYNKFTEGFDTADLREAKEMLFSER